MPRSNWSGQLTCSACRRLLEQHALADHSHNRQATYLCSSASGVLRELPAPSAA